MTSLSLSVPSVGQPHSTEDPKVGNDLTAIQTWANGNIDGVNVVASITGRRLVGQANAFIGPGVISGSYFIAQDGTLVTSGASGTKPIVAWELDPGNFAVVGKTNTQLIVRASVAVNTVSPGGSTGLNVQLYSLTWAGSAGNIVPNTNSSIGGAGFGSPITTGVAESAPFAFPAAGYYAPILGPGATTAANSAMSVAVQLFALNS